MIDWTIVIVTLITTVGTVVSGLFSWRARVGARRSIKAAAQAEMTAKSLRPPEYDEERD